MGGMSEADYRTRRRGGKQGAARPDVLVARQASAQQGVIATRQLAACGLDGKAINMRVAHGRLHPRHRGVYAVGHDALTTTGRFTAAIVACGDGAVLSDRAAAAHLSLHPWEERDVDVTVAPHRGAGRKVAGIRSHRRRLDARDVWVRDGIRVTCPARTILDVAATTPPGALRRLVRQAQADRHVNVRQLLEVLGRHRGHRGAARLRAVIADGPAPTRSLHEDRTLDLITEAGIARPAINPRLRLDGRTIEPDLLWRAPRVALECDSRRWHSDPLTRRDDADKQAILEAHGYRVLRLTWHQVVGRPQQTLARIRGALARAP